MIFNYKLIIYNTYLEVIQISGTCVDYTDISQVSGGDDIFRVVDRITDQTLASLACRLYFHKLIGNREHRMDRNRLEGAEENQINAILSATGMIFWEAT